MEEEVKKYSLISVDRGVPESTEQVEEAAGVRTTRSLVDGEETIIVSSRQSVEQLKADTSGVIDSSLNDAVAFERPVAETDEGGATSSDGRKIATSDQENEEGVPFARMQAVIVIALIVLIAVFFVYFNFLR